MALNPGVAAACDLGLLAVHLSAPLPLLPSVNFFIDCVITVANMKKYSRMDFLLG